MIFGNSVLYLLKGKQRFAVSRLAIGQQLAIWLARQSKFQERSGFTERCKFSAYGLGFRVFTAKNPTD